MYAFVHIDKTAGRTVRAVLKRSFGPGHCEIRTPYAHRPADPNDRSVIISAQDLRRVRRIYRRLRGIAGHNVRPYSDLANAAPDIRYCTFLRDPVRRYLSHFKNRADAYGRDDFERWARIEAMHDFQTRMLAGEANAQKAIDLLATRVGFVGLTETFDESLLMLGQWLGAPGFRPEYRAVNRLEAKQRPRDLQRAQVDLTYLDEPAVRERLREMNALDQQVYDFVVREIEPRQRAAYRGDLPADVQALGERSRRISDWEEPLAGRLLRNWVYKPALVLHLA
jgi:hypothetical protein